MPTIQTEKLSILIFDGSIYPRDNIDTHHIARLAEAYRAGQDFPPIIADEKSRRIVDGVHRTKMRLQVDGVDATAPVEWRTYPSEADLFLEAAVLNTHHGLRLSRFDEAHCMQIALDLGIPDDKMAAVLTLTQQKYQDLRAQRFATGPDGTPVLLKRSNRHLAGSKLTAKQVTGNSRASGMTLAYHVDQVINALQNGTTDTTDTAILDHLRRLAAAIAAFLGETADAE